jgi:homoserine O-acetyltransferase
MPRSPLRALIHPGLCALAFLAGSAPVWSRQPQPVQHEFVIRHFKTEGGVVLPEARIVYGTYGHLDAAGDNAILLPSHYMADMHGYAWLIGPGKALDPGKLFLITSELFGNGRSSSPSNTPEPFHGPRNCHRRRRGAEGHIAGRHLAEDRAWRHAQVRRIRCLSAG